MKKLAKIWRMLPAIILTITLVAASALSGLSAGKLAHDSLFSNEDVRLFAPDAAQRVANEKPFEKQVGNKSYIGSILSALLNSFKPI